MTKLILSKNNTFETETFKTWKDLYSYCYECLDNELYDVFKNSLESFERRGYEEPIDWFKDLGIDDTKDVLWDLGYTLVVA